jgi:hypothetical protein
MNIDVGLDSSVNNTPAKLPAAADATVCFLVDHPRRPP